MKEKQTATLVKIAGNMNGNKLYAILDTTGRTEYQIWKSEEYIKFNFNLI